MFLAAPIVIRMKLNLRFIFLLFTSFFIAYYVLGLINDYLGGNLFLEMMSRMAEDTRSVVNDAAIESLDQTSGGWIWGMGVQGGYDNPLFWEDSDIRTGIETGLLDVIMDGGLLLWLLMLWISIKAIINGYRLGSLESKAMSYYIGLFLLMQYPLPMPLTGLYGLSIFYCIGICLKMKHVDTEVVLSDSDLVLMPNYDEPNN
ncbi:MAG: hypothetical protein ACRCST_17705 [Turicibacter sp.]